ncbi:hypothetical protein N8T08_000359 [Aspergillus melleus]|uniref:Uncharacterized protein n=1 Tax=Aspergillus melleus TaxID=138277 RepID=A0ACC3BBC1_9EURO|nr:hypothetical protein N8T08_000359 [Aspergillus melleus]
MANAFGISASAGVRGDHVKEPQIFEMEKRKSHIGRWNTGECFALKCKPEQMEASTKGHQPGLILGPVKDYLDSSVLDDEEILERPNLGKVDLPIFLGPDMEGGC